ncbi:unnamed protein product [Fraxinus pennsylvanica]|uniref:Uncharacterized protein n=1 Tax=Fraxinus pennsylvanica TaxID=56036 RepID=A0AAD1ZSK5_9LAMI|nr:unnamed protein product [Fraxinus pennsylvanica]
MELQCRKSTFVNKLDKKYAIGIPINSMNRSPRGFLIDPACQFSVMPSPSNQHFNIGHSKADLAILRMKKLGEWMDNFTQGIREHVAIETTLSLLFGFSKKLADGAFIRMHQSVLKLGCVEQQVV